MMQTTTGGWWARHWSLAALLLIAAVWLYRTPYSASNLEVPPDSVEYAVAALQFRDTGRYEILIQDRALPPRYPPWFSLIALLPAYLLFGSEPGNAILSVTFLAVAGVGFAWAIGNRISSTAGGVLAALAIVFLPTYNLWATQVMTDVPCTALMLAACLLYLRIRSRPASAVSFLLAGALIAVATLFRPVFAAMLLPFGIAILREQQKLIARSLALMLPMFAAAAASLAYNAATFGSPTRNGYHLWTPVPSDYPALAFSLANVPMNARVVAGTAFLALAAIAIAAWLVAKMRNQAALASARQPLVDLVTFVALTAGPILLFHLVYFFPSDRFHLPLLAGAAVIAGSLVGLLIGERRANLFKLLLPAVLVLVIVGRIATPSPAPGRRIAADLVRRHTPDNAIVISALEPVYMDRLAAWQSARTIVPLSRRVEYASKVLAPKKIKDPQPPPQHWSDHRAAGLLNGGAEEAVPFVASEQIDRLVGAAQAGRPIFLELTAIGGREDGAIVGQLQKHFAFIERAPYIYELRPL
jgi:4-amino-4-deoxy-L-arabinose transferase-like glycosyltransferase